MAPTPAVALLRGINVGGRNLVAMADLRSAFAAGGHPEARTYIQSGNVVFTADGPATDVEAELESLLERELGLALTVVVRTRRQLRRVVTAAPDGFGTRPDEFHSDVVFLKAPLTPAKAMRVVATREGVDQAWAGTGVVYFARLSARRTQSRMSKIVGSPEYRLMTIRSWSTTTKLLGLLEEHRH